MTGDPNYQSAPQPVAIPNNTMAIITLVAGILGLTLLPLIGSIVAVITGPMAKREIAESGGAQGGESLAQIGTILGWLGLALSLCGCCIALIAMLFPLLMIGMEADGFSLLLPALSFF